MITVGIDEVGRGCWAGPLVAGAVVLNSHIHGLDDSKKLTKRRREILAKEIYTHGKVGLGWVTPQEIDTIGLTKAVGLAMQRAVEELNTTYDEIIIDGNINYFADDPKARAVIKADGSIPCVSAASIVAKVARDAYMAYDAHAQYPSYGFDTHVGYGTKSHILALETLGVTDIHRRSYKPIMRYV